MYGPLWANWLGSYIFKRLFHPRKVFSISLIHSRAKKSASESRKFAGNCHFLMHETRVCNEFRHKQSTTLGLGVLILQDKHAKSDQGIYFSDFEALVDKSIRWLPLVALVARWLRVRCRWSRARHPRNITLPLESLTLEWLLKICDINEIGNVMENNLKCLFTWIQFARTEISSRQIHHEIYLDFLASFNIWSLQFCQTSKTVLAIPCPPETAKFFK